MSSAYLEWSGLTATMPGESECGDRYFACAIRHGMLFGAIDGLGHGSEAAIAASAAAMTLERHAAEPLTDLLQHCHNALRLTRGATISIASFDTDNSTMTWIGVGNVEGLLLRASPRATTEKLLLRSGVVGSHLPMLYSADVPVTEGDMLVLATDGVTHDFAEALVTDGTTESIASRILERNNKCIDDALVLVARYRSGVK